MKVFAQIQPELAQPEVPVLRLVVADDNVGTMLGWAVTEELETVNFRPPLVRLIYPANADRRPAARTRATRPDL